MSHTIEKYTLKKVGKKQYLVQAKIIKRNWFGCITQMFTETLNGHYLCKHQFSYSRRRQPPSQAPTPKEKAKITVEILNSLI
jgi:hypothetical protein